MPPPTSTPFSTFQFVRSAGYACHPERSFPLSSDTNPSPAGADGVAGGVGTISVGSMPIFGRSVTRRPRSTVMIADVRSTATQVRELPNAPAVVTSH